MNFSLDYENKASDKLSQDKSLKGQMEQWVNRMSRAFKIKKYSKEHFN